MGLRTALARFAASAPAPVFAVAGLGAREAVRDLRLIDDVRLVGSPRAASILLIAGWLPDGLAEPLARVHDALPHPRATVWWPLGAPRSAALSPFAEVATVDGEVVSAIRSVHAQLLLRARRSDPAVLPDEDPAPWRGVGPFGQGGGGMTGGVPYGRPMAGLRPDRDGLRLDALPITVGPFMPGLPAGLALELTMAGDLIVEASIPENRLDPGGAAPAFGHAGPFDRALAEPVPIAELELERAREHLRWLADALAAHGLASFSIRALRLAYDVRAGDGQAVRRFAAWLRRTQVLGWATRGVGRVPGERLRGLGAGPVARASGLQEDVRLDDPGYRALAFEPVLGDGGDAAARWRQRLAEAAQSLDLAARAGDQRTGLVGVVESPRGRLERGSAPSARLLEIVPKLIEGSEWGDAITTLVSLDLDLEQAARVHEVVTVGGVS